MIPRGQPLPGPASGQSTADRAPCASHRVAWRPALPAGYPLACQTGCPAPPHRMRSPPAQKPVGVGVRTRHMRGRQKGSYVVISSIDKTRAIGSSGCLVQWLSRCTECAPPKEEGYLSVCIPCARPQGTAEHRRCCLEELCKLLCRRTCCNSAGSAEFGWFVCCVCVEVRPGATQKGNNE